MYRECNIIFFRKMMNAAGVVFLTVLLVPGGHCRPQVTASALQGALEAVQLLSTIGSSVNTKRQTSIFGTCSRSQVANIYANYPRDCFAQVRNLDLSGIFSLNANAVTAGYRFICQPRCGNPMITFYSRCGFSQYIGIVRAMCTRNDAGVFCYEKFNTLLTDEQRVITQCGLPRSSFQDCTTGCQSALITWRSENGCCINVLNNTDFRASGAIVTLSNNLWSSCGVGTPGFCNVNTSSLNVAQAPTFVKGLLLLTAIVMAMLLL